MKRQISSNGSFAFCAIALVLAVLAIPVVANTHTVLPGQSIQAAINAAVNGDEIQVTPGTYNETIDFKGKAIRIYSSAGPESTTINGNGAYPVVQCVSGETAKTILDGFVITGGTASGMIYGGGMLVSSSSPTVTGCIFTANSAFSGGGIYNNLGSPVVTQCIFRANVANIGGALYNNNGSPTVTGCLFVNNAANWFGGAVGNGGIGDTQLLNCIFKGNSADQAGGAISNYGSGLTLANCTLVGNSAPHVGGGIRNDSNSQLNIINCILWGNSPIQIDGDLAGLFINNCDVQGGLNPWYSDIIDADPHFVNITHPDPDLWNLRLQPDSPCIDVGDNFVFDAHILSTDFEGHSRKIDGNCDGTPRVDMGAYEFSYPAYGDFNNNCAVDLPDLLLLAQSWMTHPGDPAWDPTRDISDPRDNRINLLDLAVLAENWLRWLPNP